MRRWPTLDWKYFWRRCATSDSAADCCDLQIVDARGAVAAADSFDVELDVVGFFARQDAQQVAAELLARWAAKPVATPDFAEGVDAGVAAAVDGGEPLLQFFAVAEGFFNGGHPLDGESLVEEGFEFGVGEVGRIIYPQIDADDADEDKRSGDCVISVLSSARSSYSFLIQFGKYVVA